MPPTASANTLWIIANPAAPFLKALDRLPKETNIVTGLTADVFENSHTKPDVILIGTGKGDVLGQLWPKLEGLRWVHSMAAGVEHSLIPELRDSHVPFTNAKGVYARSLGEYAVAAMLFFAKEMRRMIKQQAAHEWTAFDVEELHRHTLGVVGFGSIGREAAKRAKAFGMNVIALRRKSAAPDDVVDEYVTQDQIASLMSRSDYVLVATPLTPETRGIVGDAELRAMKPTGVIINLGRGPAIVESALVQALEEKRLRGAALDVFDTEPLPADHAFYRLENVLLSPHCADHTPTWLDESMDLFIENYLRFVKGEELLNPVDKTAGY